MVLKDLEVGAKIPHHDKRELSPEERALLSNVLQGNTHAVIAWQLGVTEAIAKTRLKCLLHKIGVENRTQAAIWALANLPELNTILCGFV